MSHGLWHLCVFRSLVEESHNPSDRGLPLPYPPPAPQVCPTLEGNSHYVSSRVLQGPSKDPPKFRSKKRCEKGFKMTHKMDPKLEPQMQQAPIYLMYP